LDDRAPRITRPRLSERVSARRHVVDGNEIVVLHVDGESTLLRVEAREWAVLEAADGTRDVEGIALAARRLGGHASALRVAQFLAGLESRGLLEEGPPGHHPTGVTLRARNVPDDRPLEILPDYAFECDGLGGCCRFYATILFGPGDIARAHAHVPDHSVGIVPTERLFTPSRGSAPTPIMVPTHRDGACGFLGGDGLCEIHRAGGLAAKPFGCSAFPLRLCDDGTAVRVSVATECRCVLRSAIVPGRDPLLSVGSTHVRDLPLLSGIDALPEQVPLAGDRTLSRESVRGLFDTMLAQLPVSDPAVWLWGAAAALESGAPRKPTVADVDPWLRALAEAARRRAARDGDWRSTNDATLRGLRWIATTSLAVLHDDLLEALLVSPPVDARVETLWVRANLWGYHDVADLGVVSMLRDRAVRLWLARAMPELAPSDVADPMFEQPLAVIDVIMRGHGLSHYASDF
jgi:lysine-N-methylase